MSNVKIKPPKPRDPRIAAAAFPSHCPRAVPHGIVTLDNNRLNKRHQKALASDQTPINRDRELSSCGIDEHMLLAAGLSR